MRRTVSALALALVSASTTFARADTEVETRFFDTLARHEYDHEHYKKALRAFLLADAVTPSPRSLYNIALCADLTHERTLAFAYFDEYLEGGDTDTERRADAQQRMQALEQRLAVVRVISDPPGASIIVDRAELGSFGRAPRRLALDPGEHTVHLELDGYLPGTATVTARTGATSEARVTLAPRTGTLSLDLEPKTAVVQLTRAGVALPEGWQGHDLQLAVGAYHVRVTAPGHTAVARDVTVREGAVSKLTLVAPALPVPVGRLVVGASGVAARVLVDGRAKAVAPVTLDGLPTGRHRVHLIAKGYRPWTGIVVIRDGKTAFVDVKLRRER